MHAKHILPVFDFSSSNSVASMTLTLAQAAACRAPSISDEGEGTETSFWQLYPDMNSNCFSQGSYAPPAAQLSKSPRGIYLAFKKLGAFLLPTYAGSHANAMI